MKQNVKATLFGLAGWALFAGGVAYGNAFKPFDAYEPFHSISTKKDVTADPISRERGIVGLSEQDGHLVVEARTLAAEAGVKQGDVLTHVCNASLSGWVRSAPGVRIDATLTRNGRPFDVTLTPSLKARLDFVNESDWVVQSAAGLDALDPRTHAPVQIQAGDHLVSTCWPVATANQFVDAIGDPANNHLVEFRLTHDGQPYSVKLPKLESNGA
jgi:hypothetical protein